MKKTSSFALLAVLAVAGCTETPENVIQGQVEGLVPGDRIVLATGTLTQTPMPTDSAVVSQEGHFTLRTKAADTQAQLLLLKPGEKLDPSNSPSAWIFLEGYADLKVEGTVPDWRYLNISGGLYDQPAMKEITALESQAKDLQKRGIALMDQARQYGQMDGFDPDSLKALQDKGRELLKESSAIFGRRDPLEEAYVRDNPDAAYSAELLHYDYKTMKDFDRYDSAFRALSPRVQASPAGRAVADYIAAVRSTEVGATAPDFEGKDLDGQVLRLSDLRGKYVLIDFWGTWCGPCRASTPTLVKLYEDLRGQNFEMVSIATNERNDDYWKKVIADEKMTWRHLNDSHSPAGQEIQPAYAVMGVPSCFLIGPDGRIVLKGHPMGIHQQVRDTVSAAFKK